MTPIELEKFYKTVYDTKKSAWKPSALYTLLLKLDDMERVLVNYPAKKLHSFRCLATFALACVRNCPEDERDLVPQVIEAIQHRMDLLRMLTLHRTCSDSFKKSIFNVNDGLSTQIRKIAPAPHPKG